MNIDKKHAYDKNTVLYIEIMLGGNPICCKNVTKAHQNQRGGAVVAHAHATRGGAAARLRLRLLRALVHMLPPRLVHICREG